MTKKLAWIGLSVLTLLSALEARFLATEYQLRALNRELRDLQRRALQHQQQQSLRTGTRPITTLTLDGSWDRSAHPARQAE